MNTPFSTEQFFSVFEFYNSSTFPFQIIILLLGIFILYVALSKRAGKNQIIGGLLGIFWIWMGVVYHIVFFSTINPPAYLFGGIFILQGIFFFIETYKRKKLEFTYTGNIIDYLAVFNAGTKKFFEISGNYTNIMGSYWCYCSSQFWSNPGFYAPFYRNCCQYFHFFKTKEKPGRDC